MSKKKIGIKACKKLIKVEDFLELDLSIQITYVNFIRSFPNQIKGMDKKANAERFAKMKVKFLKKMVEQADHTISTTQIYLINELINVISTEIKIGINKTLKDKGVSNKEFLKTLGMSKKSKMSDVYIQNPMIFLKIT